MTALARRVDAAAVTLAELGALEVGTTLTWRGQDTEYGALFSALERETPPDLLALTGAAATIDLLQYQPDHRYRRLDTLTEDPGSVAAILDRLAACSSVEPVLRFAGGLELDGEGVREVPAVALWTGRTC